MDPTNRQNIQNIKPRHDTQLYPPTQEKTLSLIPLGGIEDVTKNLYVYEYGDEILIVDCGIGFADETMLGVDLLLPDISYLLQTKKKIVGMALTHGHEDHIGALPFILPQLPSMPIFASPFTAGLANEKLRGFEMQPSVKAVAFDGGEIKISNSFTISFIRVTHSVPDTAHILIKTPAGNFYHGSDFKFDLTPADAKPSEYLKIAKAGEEGIIGLMSDCLGSERAGYTPTEIHIGEHFEKEMRDCNGQFIVTTYSSNIVRLQQVIDAAKKLGRKVCFVGRSLIKAKTVAQKMGYLMIPDGMEVEMDELKDVDDKRILLLVAGAQGQENSAMFRIASGEHKDIKLHPTDTVVFSSDTIPGNEILVNALVDAIAKTKAKVIYSSITHDFYVSGHGSVNDLLLLISLTRPKHLVPISGNYKHMNAYRMIARTLGYTDKNTHLIENGQEVIFSKSGVRMGKKINTTNVYVDQVSGEEVDSFVLRDREKLAKEGIIILMVEIDASTGQPTDTIEVVARGFLPTETEKVKKTLTRVLKNTLSGKNMKVTNWVRIRKDISEIANKHIFKELRRRPLILPVVIEV